MKPNLSEPIANGGVSVSFFAAGKARPKGSHRSFVVRGRAVLTGTGRDEASWRATVSAVAADAMQAHELPPLEGPIAVVLEFFTMRPKGHFRKPRKGFVCPHGSECVHQCGPVLKPDAPVRPTSAPDGDKLWRSVGDALNGVCYRDDRQVCEATVRKRFTSPSQPLAGVRVTVSAFVGEP